MSLPWVRLDSNIASHDKIAGLVRERDGYRAACVYMFSLGWAGGHGTDGYVPEYVVPDLRGSRQTTELLLKWHLWEPIEGGFRIRNFAERQELSIVAEAKRTAKRLAGMKAACVRHHGKDCGCWKSEGSDE